MRCSSAAALYGIRPGLELGSSAARCLQSSAEEHGDGPKTDQAANEEPNFLRQQSSIVEPKMEGEGRARCGGIGSGALRILDAASWLRVEGLLSNGMYDT